MFYTIQAVFKYFEREDRDISIGELRTTFASVENGAIDYCVQWLTDVHYLEQSSYLRWRLTDEAKESIEKYKEQEHWGLQDEEILERYGIQDKRAISNQPSTNKWSIASAVVSAVFLIILLTQLF